MLNLLTRWWKGLCQQKESPVDCPVKEEDRPAECIPGKERIPKKESPVDCPMKEEYRPARCNVKKEKRPAEYNIKELFNRLKDREELAARALKSPMINNDMGEFSLQHRDTTIMGQKKVTTDPLQSKIIENLPDLNKNLSNAVQYRLAMTDVFVEKAQLHLEIRAASYKKWGYFMYFMTIVLFLVSTVLSVGRMLNLLGSTNPIPSSGHPWIDLLTKFILAFTAYGFVVITAVALARGARSCLDQRERLLSKRHSLRQGRLYVHLTGGNLTIAEMERAFDWNHSQSNAFTDMQVDTKAPWGSLAGEAVRAVPEIVKAGADAAKRKK